MEHDDEFYIGYLDPAPPRLSRFVRRVVGGLVAGGIGVAILMAVSQQPFAPSVFEFLEYRTFEGIIHEAPYPMLVVDRPGRPASEAPAASRYYLVQEGKFGAQKAVAGLNGQRVRVEGALIYRDDQTMIEIAGRGVEVIDGAGTVPSASAGRRLGRYTLVGEIVDSKCFLGVMNPGHLKPHRACAARCISGGVPPVLAVREATGPTRYLMLLGADGRTVNREVLDFVAEPLEITGDVVAYGDRLVLRADPAIYRRLP